MHTEYQEHYEVKSSSDRSFGLTVGAIFALIEVYRFWSSGIIDALGVVLLSFATPLFFLGLVHPSILAPLNRAWTKLGLLMFKVVNPIVMFAVYILTIIPIGFLMKLFGQDPLRLKLDTEAKSYWIDRDPVGPTPESMKNQF